VSLIGVTICVITAIPSIIIIIIIYYYILYLDEWLLLLHDQRQPECNRLHGIDNEHLHTADVTGRLGIMYNHPNNAAEEGCHYTGKIIQHRNDINSVDRDQYMDDNLDVDWITRNRNHGQKQSFIYPEHTHTHTGWQQNVRDSLKCIIYL